MIEVRCGFGLGNRVAAIANGLSRCNVVKFTWRNNDECPCDWQAIFPNGIPGVIFETETPPAFATKWDGMICHAWHAAGNRAIANEAYALVMDCMAGTDYDAPRDAVLARFHRHETSAGKMAMAAVGAGMTDALVFADSRREELLSALFRFGIMPTGIKTPHLVSDKARSPLDFVAFLDDWKTLSRCKRIVANCDSSLAYPAMAAGGAVFRTDLAPV